MRPDVRQSALWGSGKKGGEQRRSALWGKGGSGRLLTLAVLLAVVAFPASGSAHSLKQAPPQQGLVPASLISAATANPTEVFRVIVQGSKGDSSSALAGNIGSNLSDNKNGNGRLRHSFHSIDGVAVQLSGKDILKLARKPWVRAITPDAPTSSSSLSFSGPDYVNAEMWRQSAGITSLWSHDAVGCVKNPLTGVQIDLTCVPTPAYVAPQAPAIAIVDSGIDASKAADFGSRVVASVNFSSLDPTATGDDQGHGTMVAGIAAGASSDVPGVAQNAPLVDVRTADANGESLTSDVVAACDWILANKDQYNIRVVNLSQVADSLTSFQFDPLDQAVERLWFAGIVVVTAAGNYGTGTGPVDMSHAPGNDPFVITVGALDQNQTTDPSDDTAAWWSAYGTTGDGFEKPELSAPGRYMIMPVPAGATIPAQLPQRVVSDGYMWMSGTSFAAPVVSGAAAQVLALHPDWTPDQVKGALMLSANATQAGLAGGVGEVNAAAAASVTSPPNPNAGLDQFLTTDPATGAPVFDAASWNSAVQSSASWNSASWNSASWNSASWNSASWNSASWNSASWNSASWNSASWNSASWNSASWNSASWNSASWNASATAP